MRVHPLRRSRSRQNCESSGEASWNVASWGGAFQDAQRKAYFGPFSMQFAIRINEYFPAKNERIIEMVKAKNVTWDVVDFGSFKGDVLGEDGYLEELDYTIIDARDVLPNLVSKWYLGSLVWATLLGYRTDVFPGDKAPKKVSDFWDVKRFPGWRSIRNNPIDNVPFALAADGVPYDQIYPITEEKLKRAFKKLDEIKDHVIAW